MIETGKILIACYGSLKRGRYNHDMLGDAKYLGDDVVRGVMYLCNGYPRLYQHNPTGKMEGLARDHVVEIYEVDYPAHQDIRNVELMAGYCEVFMETKYGEARIYWARPDYHSESYRWIESY